MESKCDNTKPLYMQLYSTLKDDIENGVYKAGERIPTELELSEKYGVSRITLRNALERLTRDNYLVRYRGRGTFVKSIKYERKSGIYRNVPALGTQARSKDYKVSY